MKNPFLLTLATLLLGMHALSVSGAAPQGQSGSNGRSSENEDNLSRFFPLTKTFLLKERVSTKIRVQLIASHLNCSDAFMLSVNDYLNRSLADGVEPGSVPIHPGRTKELWMSSNYTGPADAPYQYVQVMSQNPLTQSGCQYWARFYSSNGREAGSVPIGSTPNVGQLIMFEPAE
jgi:hypothetical protein